ncbi:uncharacterized protein LOC131673469 [Phymastichus coffea]|uniref:uncharacterized protein LOC131673469 n=1 Tax=Phymastichus coffea TaxID=108790 RepID=UPI00273A8846|nr:uncharacterized protein LOC131673469 [Phymastichus coffea]
MEKMNFVILFLSATVTTQATVIKHLEREWNMTLNDLTIRDAPVGKHNTFPYAKCSLATGNERNCTVVLESFHPEGIVYKNKCFTRFYTDKGSEGVNMLQMRAVKNGKVVFTYVDIQALSKYGGTAYLVFRVLDTLTCKYHEGKVFVNMTERERETEKVQSEELYLTNVLTREDGSIDAFLIFQNLCDGGARCKVSFDANGELLGKPVSYLSKDVYYDDVKVYAEAYDTTHTAKDFFAVINRYKASIIHRNRGNERNELELIHVKADGKEKGLLHLQQEEPLIADVDIDYHGDLSICWAKRDNKDVTTVKCRHYKNNTTDLHEQSYEFELPHVIKTLKVRRTVHSEAPISALLILTDECEHESCNYYLRLLSLNTNYNDSSSRLLRYNSHNMEITGLNCPGKSKEVSITPTWNYDGLNVCVSLTCQRAVYFESHYRTVHKLIRQCFSMKYLDRAYFD